ncbi:hypothetical protein CRG98_041513 [Punica granatum]|uniref:TIR domain-containing protein n=1 Tax=Punica granatum TaxID=22663 RepID=A0A2I0I270_PUNGR|nr:hypothetical protein CRG98_041513 [Punica granatum]
MQKEMLGFLFFCVCLLFGLCSCCGFTVCAWFLCTKKIETAMGQQKEEAAEKEDDSEASVSSDYEVFLSFRGPDSRQGHADVLYNDMRTAGIRVFGDDDELDIGDKIDLALVRLDLASLSQIGLERLTEGSEQLEPRATHRASNPMAGFALESPTQARGSRTLGSSN